jgi:hypothetical protein
VTEGFQDSIILHDGRHFSGQMIISDGGKIEGFTPVTMPEDLSYPLNAELHSPLIEIKKVEISRNTMHPNQWFVVIE